VRTSSTCAGEIHSPATARRPAARANAGHLACRVKIYVREARVRLATAEPEPVGFHRRFEVLPGAQAQVDWGDEGDLPTATGSLHPYSFHMVSHSRDPFCCFDAAQHLGTFWDCHRRAFAQLAGVPR
jgi:transposase